jgi:imidazolonepropionase-like amidohydrolase
VITVQATIDEVEANKYADLIAVKGDVLKDIRVLETVGFVMKGGSIIRLSREAGEGGRRR